MYPDMRNSGQQYETVAAGQTTQALGASGAAGDYLSHVTVTPATTAPGVVTIIDGSTTVIPWLGGTVGADLKPFTIDVRANSATGAWKITTGANVSVVAFGQFT